MTLPLAFRLNGKRRLISLILSAKTARYYWLRACRTLISMTEEKIQVVEGEHGSTQTTWTMPKFEVLSIAGESTCIVLPEYKVAFDMGTLPSSSISMPHVFITHGHMDHISSLPQHISIRGLRGMGPATYYVPKVNVDAINGVLENFKLLDRGKLSYNVKGIDIGDEVNIGNNRFVNPFKTIHRIPSQGYLIWHKNKKLKKEYQGLQPKEIAALSREGVEVVDTQLIPDIAYTGDTTIEVFNESEDFKRANLLFIEVTTLDDALSREKTKSRGHIHLDDIIEVADQFKNKAIVFMHFSSRYSKTQIQKIIAEKLPDSIKSRVILALDAHQ